MNKYKSLKNTWISFTRSFRNLFLGDGNDRYIKEKSGWRLIFFRYYDSMLHVTRTEKHEKIPFLINERVLQKKPSRSYDCLLWITEYTLQLCEYRHILWIDQLASCEEAQM